MKKSVLSMVFVAALAAPVAMAGTIAGLYIGADLHFVDAGHFIHRMLFHEFIKQSKQLVNLFFKFFVFHVKSFN